MSPSLTNDWPRPILAFLFAAALAAGAATISVLLPVQSSPAAESPVDLEPGPIVTPVSEMNPNRVTIRLDEIGIQLTYPDSWGAVQVKSADQYPELEGIGRRVLFPGTGENSFGTNVDLYYSTRDFSPGRGVVFYELVSRFVDDFGLEQLCTVRRDPRYRPLYEMLLLAEDCRLARKDGKIVGSFLSYTPSLGGDSIIEFVRVVVFETGRDLYPAAALVFHYKPPSMVSTSDETAIAETYRRFRERDLDHDATSILASFEEFVASIRFL